MERLAEEFIARYEDEKRITGRLPDPGVEQLLDMENETDDILGDVGLPILSEEGRADLRGKRSADLANLMVETAAGLRACPQIQQAVQTTPEIFDQVAAQDLAIGGLIQVLQAYYRRADNGVLWTAVEAEEQLDLVEEQVNAAVRGAALSEERRNFIAYRFTEPMAARRRGWQSVQGGPVASPAVQDDEERAAQVKEQEERDAQVRAFVRKELGTPATASTTGAG